MKNVSEKIETYRIAVAQAVVKIPPDVLKLLQERKLEKGDALEMAKAAANLAAKQTPLLIPLCHPLPLESISVEYSFQESSVSVFVEVSTHAKTGVEMEALAGASVAALTLYDMLKPHAGTQLEISRVLLLKKTGGKSNFTRN